MHIRKFIFALACTGLFATATVSAQEKELTWRDDIRPIINQQCAACHGSNKPEYSDWMMLREADKDLAPRMDTYTHFMNYVVWPATGALQRRLDDGSVSGKAGNMYEYLGKDDTERAKNLLTIKTWLGGDAAWNTNRWKARNDVPAITKEQLDAIKAKY
ncbi:MAG: cytochrome C [Saezia sp.]